MQTKLLAGQQQELVVRNKNWMILTIGVFIVFIILFLCLDLLLLLRSENLGTSAPDEKSYSVVITLVLTFLYSPVWLIFNLEAWVMLLSYFGLHYLVYRLEVAVNRGHSIKSFAITVIQLLGVLTGLIGFGWWSYIGFTDQNQLKSLNNFSLIVLSPTTVLLTVGLVIMLFISLGKISVTEENIRLHEQVAGRMTIALLSALILLGLVGGTLSTLIHYDRSQWNLGNINLLEKQALVYWSATSAEIVPAGLKFGNR